MASSSLIPPYVSYGTYTPSELKIISLGIGISDATLGTLNIISDQCLIAGERIQSLSNGSNQYTYGLIVDSEGIAINTTTANRGSPQNNYAAYIDGNMRVTGNVFVDGSVFSAGGGNAQTGGGTGNFWILVNDDSYNNIYYNANVTLGNMSAASNNTYLLNLVSHSDTSIDQAQLSVQNLQASQLRIGVIGSASNAPVIFNTNPVVNSVEGGSAIEFHIGRDQNYFSNVYDLGILYDASHSEFAGSPSGYPNYLAAPPPNMTLDSAGNVGINTSVVRPVSYNQRLFLNGAVAFTPLTTAPSLFVNGATHSRDMLIYDYESGHACNIDDLYVRKLGVTFAANQVVPGAFALGDYSFVNDLEIKHNLTVDNNTLLKGTTYANMFNATSAVVEAASFCNDALFQRDLIVNQSLRVRGQIFTEVLDTISDDGTSNFAFQMIQWTPASPSLSNINLMGAGVSTPGRLGVGIDPLGNMEVNTQCAVYKTNPSIWELELVDKSDNKYGMKAGFIGHPSVSSVLRGGYDGSLVIATPSATDRDYSGTFSVFPQHIYFFPGADFSSTLHSGGGTTGPFLKANVPPTLGIFKVPPTPTSSSLSGVGINTYNPVSELDVRGTITFSGDMQYYPSTGGPKFKLGIWKQQQFTNSVPGATTLYYNGMSYIPTDPTAAHVGINTIADVNYGLIVSGGFKSNDGIYAPDRPNGADRRLGFWMDNRHAATMINNVAPNTSDVAGGLFTWACVGIGVKSPVATLEIKDNYNKGTTLQLTRGASPFNTLIYQGGIADDMWQVQTNHVSPRYEIGYGATGLSADSNVRYMWMRPNPMSGAPQVAIGTNIQTSLDASAMLTVGGNLSVKGDVNITGQFKINAVPLVNSNVVGTAQPVLNDNDVYIGGANIQIKPDSGYGVIVGTPFAGNLNSMPDADKMFRVYAPSVPTNQGIVASFQGNTDTALVELVAYSTNKKLIFGTLNPGGSINGNSTYGTSFAFMNEHFQPYISFQTLTTNAVNAGYVGFGVPLGQAPNAIIQLYTEGTGANMLRLTKGVLNGDTSPDAPQLEFQKNYQSTSGDLGSVTKAPTSWKFVGPNSSYQEKLSLVYSDASTLTPSELYVFANNGCLGIGQTQPQFSIDIANSNAVGALRLWDVGPSAAPHIVFQSGDRTYGADDLIDYRMISSNNGFRIDSQSVSGISTIMDVAANNHIGIGTVSDWQYDVILNGVVNVGQSIYLQGAPLFSAGDAISGGTTITSTNIFINPVIDSVNNGAVVVNGTVATGNLFTINSAYNANLLTLDSAYNNAQVNMRTVSPRGVYSMYRMEMSNVEFLWQFNSNCFNNLTIGDDNNGFADVMYMAPTKRTNVGPAVGSNVAPGVTEFDLTVYGSVIASSTVNPAVYLGTMASMGASNNSAYIKSASGSLGVGTYAPQAALHVASPSASAPTSTSLLVTNGAGAATFSVTASGDVAALGNVAAQGNITVQGGVNAQGSITTQSNITAQGSVTVQGNIVTQSAVTAQGLVTCSGTAATGLGTASTPAYTFTSTPTTGLFSPTAGTLSVTATGTEQLRVSNNLINMYSPLQVLNNLSVGTSGVGIGTSVTRFGYAVNIVGTTGITGHLLPTDNALYDLGSTTNRWRDLYLSGSINLGTTLISQTTDGSVALSSTSGQAQRLAAKDLLLGADVASQVVVQGVGSNICLLTNGASTSNYPLFTDSLGSTVYIGGGPGASAGAGTESGTGVWAGTGAGGALNVYASNAIATGGAMPGILVNQCSSPYNASSNNDVLRLLANNAPVFTVQQGGNIGVGTSAPQSNLHVAGTSLFDDHATFRTNVNMDANIYVYGNSYVSGNQTTGVMSTNNSDRRLKKDLVKITSALDKLKTLTGYTYNRIDTYDERRYTGLIAQDVQAVLPEAVLTEGGPDGILSVAYGNMMSLIVEAIKELASRIP